MSSATSSGAETGELSSSTVQVTFDDGIAWVVLNRPDKRNAMNPTMNREMNVILDALEIDDRCKVLILTGAGNAFTAGMDLKEFFRETAGFDPIKRHRMMAQATNWQWRKLRYFAKPTIAMVNGWTFGGGFVPLIACDVAIAAEDAIFGVSEINWGIIPAGNVTKAIEAVLNERKALLYIMTGDPFDGKKAAEIGLVTESVPQSELRATVVALAQKLMKKNPITLWNAKVAFKHIGEMDWELSEEYLTAKAIANARMDPERGSERGLKQFLDDKSYKPGLGEYRREE
jgi:trans-feruloyl-CoA hydratase/vanillin synthase